MPGPLATIGLSLGASALNKMILGSSGSTQGYKPLAKDYVMGRGEQGALRNIGRRGIGEQVSTGVSGLTRSAAAENLPSSALASGISGIVGKGAEAVTNVDAQINAEKQRRKMTYLDALERFKNRDAERTAAGFNLTPEIGTLTKAMLMYKSGFMDTESGGDVDMEPGVASLFPRS